MSLLDHLNSDQRWGLGLVAVGVAILLLAVGTSTPGTGVFAVMLISLGLITAIAGTRDAR